MSILLNGIAVEELSNIVHISKAQTIGKAMALKLKDIIPRQMISIAIQAVVGGKVMARQDLKAYRKDVTQWLVSMILVTGTPQFTITRTYNQPAIRGNEQTVTLYNSSNTS